jgi:hypothetical protein
VKIEAIIFVHLFQEDGAHHIGHIVFMNIFFFYSIFGVVWIVACTVSINCTSFSEVGGQICSFARSTCRVWIIYMDVIYFHLIEITRFTMLLL